MATAGAHLDERDTRGSMTRILDRRFLGLAMMEFWERFAMAGVKSLLVLILADEIFAGTGRPATGALALRAVFESWFGPLSTTGLASQVYGYAGALLYLSVPLGGLIGDLIARRHTVICCGAAAMIAGLGLMLQVPTFLPGLALFMVSTGTLKGNLSAQLGQLLCGEVERQRGYALYLGFLNAGVICGPLVCGTLAALAGWPYAIGAAAIAVLLGVGGYLATATRLPADAALPVRETGPATAAQGAGMRSSAILVAAILSIYFCWSAYEQLGDIFLIWARARIELHVHGWAMPVAWFVSLDGVFTLLLIAGAQGFFPWLARSGIGLGPEDHILLGGLCCASGYLLLALASMGDGPLSIGWALAYLILIDAAVVLVWPSGLTLIAAVAPPRFVGFWIGLFYLHGFFASLWVGISGSLYGRTSDGRFWLLQAAMAGVAVMLALLATALRRRASAVQATTTSA
ncbi:MFS transporter [Sphingomonas sp. TREG-RG-20F-R18-01]|uniref:POT-type proton-dependent oligopeptide transporter n=1 Tax=Sphingomonas sp. TREG-RG-20F-R18-01 TaxID=2914982 RepID=UPI001F59578C|nr:MFS transporter [Sphingomonas sp. TREG-RG-20F-R18-01]